tara:strand:+ start:76 stop:333 length:258 start_codon:yes stop_codon:yes gene_type:complete
MKIKYKLKFEATCPSDKQIITYKAIIFTEEFQSVENINSYVSSLKDEKIYQEDLTKRLSRDFRGRVVTYGKHQGVKIKCECNFFV